MQLMQLFESHAKLSTRKRVGGMSKPAYTFLKCYLRKYVDSNGDVVDRARFISWIAGLDVAVSTKGAIASGLGKFFHWNGYISNEDYNIAKKAFRPADKSWSDIALEKDDVEKAFIASYQISSHELAYKRNPAIVALFAVLGARVGQIVDLNMSDVIFGDYITVRLTRQKDVRTGLRPNLDIKKIPKDISVGRYTIEYILHKYLEVRQSYVLSDSNDEPFFINQQGQRLSTTYIQIFVKKISKKLGKRITPHSFRHYVGSHVAMKYGLYQACVVLGHSKITTTQRYVNPEQTDVSEFLRL